MTISASLTSLAQVVNINGPNSERDDIDITHLGSGVQRDFLPGLIDPGQVSADLMYDPNGSTHQAITDQLVLTTTVACKVIWSDATEIPFTAYVKSFSPSATLGGALEASVTFKVSDAISWPT